MLCYVEHTVYNDEFCDIDREKVRVLLWGTIFVFRKIAICLVVEYFT